MGNMERGTSGRGRVAIAIAVLLAAVASFGAGPVAAETVDVPIGDTAVAGQPGDVIPLGSAAVAADLVGRACEITAVVTNQESAHPGNKLIITSGDSTLELDGIEDVANEVTTSTGTVTLGSSIDVAVMLGPDRTLSSLGSSLTVTCVALPPSPPPPAVEGQPTYTG